MSNNVMQDLSTTAFGDLRVAELTPILQITAQYGIRDDVLVANLGGTTSSVDSKFVASTGTGVNNVSAIVSARQASYRAGQGLLGRLTAIFTNGKPNSTQQAGFITSESSFAFGFNGVDFGIVHSRDGALEQQELQITVGATGAENATVTIDGTPYVVPLTGGSSVIKTAFEVSESLNAQALGYDFSSANDVVYCLAQLPDFGGGLFSFSSATAVGSFTQIESGTLPTETWIKKEDWNVNSAIDINPTLGNVYEIQLQYLGFGGIRFYIENPETAQFELVHIIRYANTSIVPSVKNPIFRVGWAARNKGNNTDIVVQGASAGAFIEGQVFFDGKKRGLGVNQVGVGSSLNVFSIISIQNRLTYFGSSNRAEILLKSLSVSTDTTKTAEFHVILNPVVLSGQFLDFQQLTANDLAQVSTSLVEVTGGEILSVFNAKSQGSFKADIENTVSALLPGDILCIAARVSSGAASEMNAALSWQDDL